MSVNRIAAWERNLKCKGVQPEKKRAEPEMNKRGWSPKSDSTRGGGFQQPGSQIADLSPQKPPGDKQNRHHEQRPKYRLVVSRQPKRQIDVEIISALRRVTARQAGQRASPPVQRKHRTLDQHQDGQNPGPELTKGSRKGIATIHPAKNAQIAVCSSLIATSMGICSDRFLMEEPG